MTVHSILDRPRPMDQSCIFDELTGQRVGHKKTIAFSSPQEKNVELISRGERLKSVNAEKSLGILMEVRGKIVTSLHDNRIKKLKGVTAIIRTLLVSIDKTAKLISFKTAGARN